jgi:hypothetical protein
MSCNPDMVHGSARISSSRSSNVLIIVSLESWDNFSELSWGLSVQILMLAMTFSADKKIRIVTKSRVGHPLNN